MAQAAHRHKNIRRPKKTNSRQGHRQKLHRARLVELGVPEETVNSLNPKTVRDLLVRPAQVQRELKRRGIVTPQV